MDERRHAERRLGSLLVGSHGTGLSEVDGVAYRFRTSHQQESSGWDGSRRQETPGLAEDVDIIRRRLELLEGQAEQVQAGSSAGRGWC